MKAKKLLVVLCAAVMCLSLGILGACSHEHDWSAWKVTTAATCTEKGVETRTCDCGETETRDIAALGHDWGAWTLSADGSAYTRACKRDKCTATESKAAGSAEEYPLVVSDKAALADAIEKGGYIKLSADATLTASELNAALAANRTAPAGEEDFTPAAISIDLGGKTLTVSAEASASIEIIDGQNLTIKNGTFKAENILTTSAQSHFAIESGAVMTLNNVTATGNAVFFYPKGDATAVNIIDSEVTTGTFVVSSNAATVENYGVVINIENSTLVSETAAAVIINVAGTLNISDSDITGVDQGVVVRAGTAVLDNVNVTAVYNDKNLQANVKDCMINPSSWKDGNWLAGGALVVGDISATAYNASAIVTVNGGSYKSVAAEEDSTQVDPFLASIYAVQLNGGDGEDAYTSEITLTGDVELANRVINWNDTAEITGLDDSVTVLGKWDGEKFVEYQAPADEEEAA